MRVLLISIFGIFLPSLLVAQVIEFDELEMQYDQLQYKKVYKQAQRYLAQPEYDYSYLPRYYYTLASLQLAQDKKWRKKNKYAIQEAEEFFNDLTSTIEGKRLIEAHLYEMSTLKSDLYKWLYILDQENDQNTFKEVKNLINSIFSKIPEVEEMKEDEILVKKGEPAVVNTPHVEEVKYLSEREKIIHTAENLLGIPYKWGGNTPQGFDCSGFICYVYGQELGKSLERSSSGQYKEVKKIKPKNAQIGDLIFFNTSSGVSHVGIIYSLENESIQMIHASSSIGVSIVDIYESSYWKKRIVGFGTYL